MAGKKANEHSGHTCACGSSTMMRCTVKRCHTLIEMAAASSCVRLLTKDRTFALATRSCTATWRSRDLAAINRVLALRDVATRSHAVVQRPHRWISTIACGHECAAHAHFGSVMYSASEMLSRVAHPSGGSSASTNYSQY